MITSAYRIDRAADRAAARVRVRLTGRFDRTALPALQRAVIGELMHPHTREVVVDVGELTVIDRPGVQVLLRGYTAALRGGRGFRVVGARDRARLVLQRAGLCADDGDAAASPPASGVSG